MVMGVGLKLTLISHCSPKIAINKIDSILYKMLFATSTILISSSASFGGLPSVGQFLIQLQHILNELNHSIMSSHIFGIGKVDGADGGCSIKRFS